MQFESEVILGSESNISSAFVSNNIIYNYINGVLSGAGTVRIIPESTGLCSLKIKAPEDILDFMCFGKGVGRIVPGGLSGDVCDVQPSTWTDEEGEHTAFLISFKCSTTDEQDFVFDFIGQSAG